MKHYALIGRTLTHSYSKQLFDAQGFVDTDYRLQPLSSLKDLHEWVRHEGIDGFNVTKPYKQAIMPLLDELSPEARAIGAVNCVCNNRGRLIGHNTDAPAFRLTLESLLQSSIRTIKQSYILGTGGAARAVAYALKQTGIAYTFVSRHPGLHSDAIGYDQLSTSHFSLPTLIVNATPVGTYPNVDHSPLDLSSFNFHLSPFTLYDLVYNPSPSLLMRQAAAHGAITKDGLEMLHRQAELSWKLWGLEQLPQHQL